MRILWLCAAGIVAVSAIAQPQAPAAPPKWEAASVRPCEPTPDVAGRRGGGMSVTPGRLHITCIPTMFLSLSAYVSFANEILRPAESVPVSGGPTWLNSDPYDIEAKAEGNPSGQK